MGFRIDSTTGSYRLIRCFDSSQAQLYSVKGTIAVASTISGRPVPGSGALALINDSYITYEEVVSLGFALAQQILADEFQRRPLPKFALPSLASGPG